MHVRRVPEKKRSTHTEAGRHSVVDAVGREPVDLLDLETQLLDGTAPDVGEGQVSFRVRDRVAAHGAYEPDVAFAFHVEHRQQVCFIQVDVDAVADRGAACGDVGDVEQVLVRAAAEIGADHFAHDRARAVTAGNEGAAAALLGAVGSPKGRAHAVAVIFEGRQLCLSLDGDAECLEAPDEQSLMRILRKVENEGETSQSLPDVAEGDTGYLSAPGPEIHARHDDATGDDLVGEAELPVELQRSSMNAEGARDRRHILRLVDDAEAHTEPGEPQREREAGGPRPDNQHLRVGADGRRRARVIARCHLRSKSSHTVAR